MTTICGFDPVKIDTEDKKTLHTLEPRLIKDNATQLSSSALITLPLKQMDALNEKHPSEDSSDPHTFGVQLSQSCTAMTVSTDYLLGPVLDVTSSTVQEGG
jgi:hypothetical protein